jgi:hypothetical protein
MWAMWIANGVNLALNLLLVPDILGIGLDGAVGLGLGDLLRPDVAGRLPAGLHRAPARGAGAGRVPKPERNPLDEREQRKVGYGAGAVRYFIEVGAFAAMTFIAGQLGAIETAAWAIVLNVSAIVFMVPMGLSAATAVLVGRAYGAKDGRGVLRAGLVGIGVVIALTLVVALAVWPGAPLMASAYNRDPALLAVVIPALVLTTLFFVADGIQVVSASANRAAGDVWWPTIMHFGAYTLVMMPLGWVLAHEIGVNGLVWAVIIASLVSSALLTGRFIGWRGGCRLTLHEAQRIAVRVVDVELARAPGLVDRPLMHRRIRLGRTGRSRVPESPRTGRRRPWSTSARPPDRRRRRPDGWTGAVRRRRASTGRRRGLPGRTRCSPARNPAPGVEVDRTGHPLHLTDGMTAMGGSPGRTGGDDAPTPSISHASPYDRIPMARILITSALPYINGIKHLGNLAGSMLPADVWARFKRAQGHEVLYICATDEHGTPAELAAAAAGQDVRTYCDEQHEVQKAAGRPSASATTGSAGPPTPPTSA